MSEKSLIQQVRRDAMLERFAGLAMQKLITIQTTKEGRRVECDIETAWKLAEGMVEYAEKRANAKQ